jgi:hypothetical protein
MQLEIKHACQSCGEVMAVHKHASYQEVKDCLAGMKPLCSSRASWPGCPFPMLGRGGRRITMSDVVEALKRLGPWNVVDGAELCRACDGLSPALGFRRTASGELEECMVNCSVCDNRHVVSVEEADRWRREMRTKYAGRKGFSS